MQKLTFIVLVACWAQLSSGRSQFGLFSAPGAVSCTQDCPPDLYEPICGSDGNTYNSDCDLENAVCSSFSTSGPRLFKVADGECRGVSATPPCPDVCPDVYQPVCGSDGNTYNNDCELTSASCQDASIFQVDNGDCGGSASSSSCSEACPQEYQPVCGNDGNTYYNECELKSAACQDPSIFKLADFDCEGTVTGSSTGPSFDSSPSSSDSFIFPGPSSHSGSSESSGAFTGLPQSSGVFRGPPQSSGVFGGPLESSGAFTRRPHSSESSGLFSESSGFFGDSFDTDSESEVESDVESDPAGDFVGSVHEGLKEVAENCGENCGEEFFPVCGSDGRTYNNDCYFQAAVCKDPSLYKADDGEC